MVEKETKRIGNIKCPIQRQEDLIQDRESSSLLLKWVVGRVETFQALVFAASSHMAFQGLISSRWLGERNDEVLDNSG